MVEVDVVGVSLEGIMGSSLLIQAGAIIIWITGGILVGISVYQMRKTLNLEDKQKETVIKRLIKCNYIT